MKYRRIALMLAMLMVTMAALSGCSGSETIANTSAVDTAPVTVSETIIPTPNTTNLNNSDEASPSPTADAVWVTPGLASGLDSTQRNSISMLNHLAVLTQEINASSNSRLYLEEAYSLLINNTYPNAVDSRTLSQLASILDTLEEYRMVAVKRERLAYVYEQNRAQSLRASVPNPLGLLSAVRSFNLSGLAASVVYMAVDSASSYTSRTGQADLQYLQDGWALDDEAATALHNSRKDTFSYMVRIVGDYNLPGEIALSESAVDEFVFWETNDNVTQRIQFLEANMDTYQALENYWLVLAESYFEAGEYAKCLNAITSYEAMNIRIFRKDYEYARVLPLAIIAAGEALNGDDYISTVTRYVDSLLENTDYNDWSLRYFAAQACIELYVRTKDTSYIEKAYELAINNANSLVNDQRALNTTYLAAVVEAPAPAGATDEDKKEINNYNIQLREERKTALPPVYEPLLVNCDLLFALADKLAVTTQEREKIDGILHWQGSPLFLCEPLDNLFYATGMDKPSTADVEIGFNGRELTIPARFLSDNSVITVTLDDPKIETPVVFNDWIITKVERKAEGELSTFTATYYSPSAQKHSYTANTSIKIEIQAREGSKAEPVSAEYLAVAGKILLVFDTINFQRVK